MATILPGSARAEYSYATGITLVAEWSKPLGQFTGRDSSSAIVTEERAGNGRGDEVEVRFSDMDLSTAPLVGTEPLIGHEMDTTEYSHTVKLQKFKHGVALEDEDSESEMVSYDVKAPKLYYLGEWFAQVFETQRIHHLVGNATTAINAAADYRLSAGNAVTAFDSEHIYYVQGGGGANTTDAEVAADTDAVLTTDVIDDLVTYASDKDQLTYGIVPCDTPFGTLWVFMTDPIGLQQLHSSVSGNEVREISHDMLQGGKEYMDNPLFTHGGFIYRQTLCISNPFMPRGLTSGAAQANTRANVFFGARALTQVFAGRSAEGDHLAYKEFVALDRWTGQASTIWGCNRTIVNGKTWGAIRVVHYVPR